MHPTSSRACNLSVSFSAKNGQTQAPIYWGFQKSRSLFLDPFLKTVVFKIYMKEPLFSEATKSRVLLGFAKPA